jgi:hypothetical protein
MPIDPEENPEYTVSFFGEPRIPMTGRVARMHNITYVPLTKDESMEHDMAHEGTRYNEYRLHRDEPLFTEQSHFGTMGIRHYVDNPTVNTAWAGSDKPEVYPDRDGALWINEGHHRIIASRLRGEPYIDVLKHESYWE